MKSITPSRSSGISPHNHEPNLIFALIPQCEYQRSFRKFSIRAVQHKIPSLKDADTNLLMDLQYIFDKIPKHQQPEEVLKLFNKYGVSYP